DTVGTRLSNARDGLADNGGGWVRYFGGNFNGGNGTINYVQDGNGRLVGVDAKGDGNNAMGIVGLAAGVAKVDLSDRTVQVDQDRQTAYIYSSARFSYHTYVSDDFSYYHFNDYLSSHMIAGIYVDVYPRSD
ncbi:autotransporter outer membrane beta-barrel domain-containing protein, partial [Salmonella enterica]|uniref:autotransporter outer membrane beta-barrel domain-containing protein n=1 Tax=Salmonella enterica TaxID=28901 RepID=UPI00398C2D18